MRGGTLNDDVDELPAEHATIPHATTTAKAPHPARHHRPRRRPDEPEDDGAPDGGSPHSTDEPDDPPHDADGDSPHGTGIGAPDGRRTGNHDTEELLPQGP